MTSSPVEDLIFKDARTELDATLLVDVAGGHGHDLLAFKNRFPGHGPLVLQDLKSIRRQSILLPLHLPRLARQEVPRAAQQHRSRHGTWIF